MRKSTIIRSLVYPGLTLTLNPKPEKRAQNVGNLRTPSTYRSTPVFKLSVKKVSSGSPPSNPPALCFWRFRALFTPIRTALIGPLSRL